MAAIATDTTTANTDTTPEALTKPKARKPQTVGQWASTWEPDRRWVHPYVATSWIWGMSWLPSLADIPWWGMGVAGAATTAIGAWIARRCAPAAKFGDRHRNQITGLTVGAGAAATAWMEWVALAGHTPLWGPHVGSLLLGGTVAGAMYAGWQTKRDARADEITRVRENAARQEFLRVWTVIMRRAGYGELEAVAWRPNRAGWTIDLEQRSNSRSPATGPTLQAGVESIAAVASRIYAKVEAIQIGPRSIRIEEVDGFAHRFTMHVTTKNILGEDIEYVPRTEIASINDPIDIGKYDVGDPIELGSTNMNLKIVGASRSGKGVVLNTMMARWVECDDDVLWVAGAAKLIPLVYPWLEPWATGATRRPVIDWVAGEDQQEVLMLLADAYRAAKRRADLLTRESKLVASPRLPALLVLLDEASTALEDPTRIDVDGKRMDASELVKNITQIGLAVNVGVVAATQFGMLPNFGPSGSEIHRNLNARIALKTFSASDGRDTLIGMDKVDTTKLKPHTMLVQPSTEDPRTLPAKAAHMEDSSRIAPHAARCTPHLAYLDEYTAEQLVHYENRWHPTRQKTLYKAIKQEGLDIPDWVETTRACVGGDTDTIKERFDRIITDQTDQKEDSSVNAPTTENNGPAFDDGTAAGRMATASADLEAGMNELAEGFARANDNMGAIYKIAEPLREIAVQLSMPKAPKGDTFVPTTQLAIVIDRVAPDADADTLKSAAIQLGREINKQCPSLTSEQKTVGGKQVRGYTAEDLWKGIRAVAGVDK